MTKDYRTLKKTAIRLRKRGLSYGEIERIISVPKSTLSFWLKAIVLEPEAKKRLYTKQIEILSRGPQSQKERREREITKIIEEAEKEIALPVTFETFRLLGAILYWAEGSKTQSFCISNSDPHLILFMINWLGKVFQISPGNIRAWLNIYSQQNERKIKQFWSQLTGIPLKNFGKSFIKPPNKGFKKNNLYYGTIKIHVPKGTDMRYRVFGWIKALSKENTLNVNITQKRWKSLRETCRATNLLEK